MGIRDRRRGRGARHQPVRRTERVRSEGEDQGPARRVRDERPPARACPVRVVADARRLRGGHRRLAGGDRPRGAAVDRAARLRRVPVVPAGCAPRSKRASRRFETGSARNSRSASTLGVGPRYLHSTGQYHKGGPNSVVTFVITGEDERQTEIPDAGYTFSVLKRAQALGDVETLAAHKRRVVRLHIRKGATIADVEATFRGRTVSRQSVVVGRESQSTVTVEGR